MPLLDKGGHLLLLQRLGLDLLGGTPWALRLPALLGAVVSLLLVQPVGRRLVGEAPAAVATLGLALSPIHVFYTRYGRAYSMATCLGVLFVLALVRILDEERPRARWFVLLAITGALVPYAHLFGATFVAPVAAVGLALGLAAQVL